MTFEQFQQHAPGVEEALRRCGDPQTIEDVVAEIARGHAQIWGDERALLVTQVAGTYLHFWIATGELHATIEWSHRAMEWARTHYGCTKSTLTGRRGWLRALKSEGWREQAILLERDITDG